MRRDDRAPGRLVFCPNVGLLAAILSITTTELKEVPLDHWVGIPR